jgi:DNA-binding response OmpR family regulator
VPVTDSTPEKRSRILLVSPETNFHRTLQRILCRCGYEIDVVDTGEEALERVRRSPFDAIVSQVHLPGEICGLTLLNRLRALGMDVPVVMLTEKETTRLREALGATTGATCVLKDTDLDSLKSMLAACLSAR